MIWSLISLIKKKNNASLVKESNEKSLYKLNKKGVDKNYFPIKSNYKKYMKFFDDNIYEGNIEISNKLI